MSESVSGELCIHRGHLCLLLDHQVHSTSLMQLDELQKVADCHSCPNKSPYAS